MHEYDQRYIDGVMEGGGQYQLDVDINSLEFSHHHLFSKEHVLAGKLFDLYEQYYIRKKKNMTEFLREKVCPYSISLGDNIYKVAIKK